jgi:hypothetical protein
MEDIRRRRPNWSTIVVGLLLMLFGVTLILRNTGIIEWAALKHFWPFIPIGIGVVKLLQPVAKKRREGAFILFVGVWLLLNASNVLRHRDSWPILLVGWGIGITWNAIVPPARRGVNDD